MLLPPTVSVSSHPQDDNCLARDRQERRLAHHQTLKLAGAHIWVDMVLGMLLFHFLTFFASVTALSITSDPAQVVNKTFTHVVIGGGTAGRIYLFLSELTRLLIEASLNFEPWIFVGLTVASRLAEDSRFSVLVIEAGPDEQNNTIINDPAESTPAATTFSWQYQTTPQTVGGNVLTILQSVP